MSAEMGRLCWQAPIYSVNVDQSQNLCVYVYVHVHVHVNVHECECEYVGERFSNLGQTDRSRSYWTRVDFSLTHSPSHPLAPSPPRSLYCYFQRSALPHPSRPA